MENLPPEMLADIEARLLARQQAAEAWRHARALLDVAEQMHDSNEASLAYVCDLLEKLAPGSGLSFGGWQPVKSLSISSRIIFDRDDWTCQECGTHRNLTVDHIVPRIKGGTDDPRNLQTLCLPCNSRKRDR